MNKIFYICIGFILGITVGMILFLQEILGKINLKLLKKFWKILTK